ncbi:C2 and GRAM domain-containing protein [Glycine soja]
MVDSFYILVINSITLLEDLSGILVLVPFEFYYVIMKLVVRVIEAKNLPPTDPNGLSDPYVRLQLGKHRFRTKVIKKCLNPKWDEEFSFRVDDLNEELVISVMDEDKFFNDDFVGQLKVPISIVFEEEIKSLGTAWYSLQPKSKKSKNKESGEIRLSIYFLQNNATMESNDSGDLLLHPRMTELPSRSSTSPSNSSSPVREEITSAKDEKSSTQKTITGRIAQIFSKSSDMSSTASRRSIDLDQSEISKVEVSEMKAEDQSSNETFEEAMRKLQSADQGSEIPSNLPAGVFIDQQYVIAPEDLNELLFSSDSNFLKSLAEVQGNTELEIGPWKFENDGEIFKRLDSFDQYATLLSQTVKPADLKDLSSNKEQALASLHAEPESDWRLAVQYFGNFTVFATVFMGLYVLVHIWLAAPSTIQGLEFGGLDLPDSIGEFVVCAVLVLQGECMLGKISRFIKARAQKGSDHGIKAQGDGWLLTVALIEGSSLASVDSSGLSDPYVVFTCNGKTRTSSIKFQKSNLTWNEIFEFDAMDDPPSVLDVVVYDFDGPFDEAASLGHAEINFLKANIADLADIWVPLEGKLALACQSKLHLRIFLDNTRGGNVAKDYLSRMEKEVGKKINLRSPQANSAFQKLFGLPPEEFLINDFTCHLKRKMPLQGRLFLSARIIGFHANLFGNKTKFFFLWEDIEDIQVIPPTFSSMGSPIIVITLRKGRGVDARHGAKTQDEQGRLRFHFQSFVSFNVAHSGQRERKTEGRGETESGSQNELRQQQAWSISERDKGDITTFYFTRFHEHITEEDLWAQFKKWGDVRDIFIHKHRNKGGRRYGFVRFKGVLDKYRLEKQLDNIILDGLKMYVNVPKYGRGKARVKECTSKLGILKEGHSREVEAGRHRAVQHRNPQKSYTKVVSTIQTDDGKMKHPKLPQLRYVESPLLMGEKKWFTDAWVGRLKKLQALERIEDDIPWELGVNVVPKYLGDDMVLLLGLADNKAEHIIAEETQHGTSLFHSLERWNPTMRPGHRLVWAQCWDIPIEAWDLGNIRKIAAAIGELVEVDDDVKEMRRMDRARILIRTPWKPFFHHTVSSMISPYSPRYEIRRQPNNPHDDPEAVVDSGGGPRIGTGIPIGRATDPPEANHSDDPGGNPLNVAHVQSISCRGRKASLDGDTVPVATDKPRSPLPKGPTAIENTVDITREAGVMEQEDKGKGSETTINNGEINVGPTYQTAEGNKQWKVFIRRKGCKQQMTQKDLTNGKATKSIFLGMNPHTESIGTATSKRSKEANSQIPVKSIGADEGQIEEALTQWELAKLMGVSTDSEQTTIIHKIIDMETRDKKKAEDLGLGRKVKWAAVRRLVRKHKVDILCIQETKKKQIDKPMCQALWGDMDVVWEFQPAVNTAGGLLCIWNEQTFKVERRVKGTGYILLEGVWTQKNQRLFIVNIYSPCDSQNKRELWESLMQLRQQIPEGMWCFLGDFNSIRHPSERQGVSHRGVELTEIPSVGRKFTWFKPNGASKSKLDRFLASHEWLLKWPDCTTFVLDRNFSDHCPILLSATNTDKGPKPFKVFDCWLKDKSFVRTVTKCWRNAQPKGWGGYVLKEKIKNLKEILKSTIMALWKVRSLSPEQKVEFVEEQSDSKSLISDESGSFLGLDDVSMSEIYSCSLLIPASYLMEIFSGGELDRRVMEKLGYLNYSYTPWVSENLDISERAVYYKFEKRISSYKGEVTSTQQRSPLPDGKGWLVEELMNLHGVPLGDYFNIHLRYQIEDLPPKAKGCRVQVLFGMEWLKSSKNQKRLTKNILENLLERFKVTFSLAEKELLPN